VTRPLMATKLYVPKLRRGLVARPRLLKRMGDGAEARLTLVSAPAGFGKTTVLAAWLHDASAEGRCVAWLSLDAADNEPASFWAYVVTAFQGAVPGVGASALELLASSPVPTELVLTTLLNELVAAPGEVWLVLDDYHLVDNHEVNDGVAFLLEHLPAQVHVVVSTRADPDLPLARWRVRGELVEIRAADLRFTSAEATAYLQAVAGLDLPAEDVAVLEERTEGWIAALQLAALSLQGREDVSGFIARFAGDDRYVVDYLVEEVLRHQPDAVRGFLLQSAVLDRLTGLLCDTVTGRDDGSEMLVALERANLFIVPLDDRREWYRYHHLFADVLRARMLSEQPDHVSLLHQRASQWFERHDLTEEAVRHALAARDFDRAAHLLELAMPAIRRHRQEAMLYGWLTALPDDTVRRNPVLSVFYGDMLMHSGDLDAVGPRLDDAERALAAVPGGKTPPWADTQELRTLPATIAIYRASLAQARGDAAGTAEHARRALDLAGPSDHLARGGAAGFLGLAAWAQGDVPSALETFAQAVASLHAAGNLLDELSSTVVLADLWRAAGRPSKARWLYERALQQAEAHGEAVSRATADLHVGLGEIDVEVGDLASAREHLQSAVAPGERAGMNEGRYRWFVAMGLLAKADGEPNEAVRLLDQAAELYRPGFFPDVRPIAAIKARVWIAQGRLSEAAEWIRERGVAATDEASYLGEFDHLTLVRLLIARHRAEPDTGTLVQVVDLLDRLHEAAETSGRAGSLVEIRLLQALVQDAQGHRRRALEFLAQALGLAPEPDGYLRLFMDEGAPLLSLLRDATDHGVAGDAEYQKVAGDRAQRLLALASAPAAPALDSSQRQAASSAEPLSDRELQVLRLLDSELTGPQIARELFVSHNTVRTHTKHIFTKLDVTNRRAAVLRARERGLL
jgi:LuxR family transcriptional regulator, maltose regulon positive regulatory protein